MKLFIVVFLMMYFFVCTILYREFGVSSLLSGLTAWVVAIVAAIDAVRIWIKLRPEPKH